MIRLEKLLVNAHKKENALSLACDAIAAEVQKRIDWTDEISCLFQPSDGFVIMVDLGNNAPENIPVQYFIDTWADHKTYTKENLTYLN